MAKLKTMVLLALAGITIFCASPIFAADLTNTIEQTKEAEPFEIIATLLTNQMHINNLKEPLKIALEVKNVTNTNQSFEIMNCGWPSQWRSDSPFIGVATPLYSCTRNFPIAIVLPPGKSWENEIKMWAPGPVSTNKISFRMGFAPLVWGPIDRYSSVHNSSQTNQFWIDGEKFYWSNEVTIDLIPN